MDFIKRNLKTKSFWLGVLSIAWGVYEMVSGNLDSGKAEIGAGLGLIFVRDAIAKQS